MGHDISPMCVIVLCLDGTLYLSHQKHCMVVRHCLNMLLHLTSYHNADEKGWFGLKGYILDDLRIAGKLSNRYF